MTTRPDDITKANEKAKDEFSGTPEAPEKADTVTDVNEAADAEFNDDTDKPALDPLPGNSD